jgi:cellulose synthase/poly-beta-1,6-N-acetylglucosamine synthase-like glycosyltransferase
MEIRHIDIRVETDVPDTWSALFRQRRIWWAGNFRHVMVNIDRNLLQSPFWVAYYAGLVWIALYFKWSHVMHGLLDPSKLVVYLPLLLLVYVGVTYAANWQVRSRWMIPFPAYALAQVVLMPFVGAIWFGAQYRRTRNLGRYRFGCRSPATVVWSTRPPS